MSAAAVMLVKDEADVIRFTVEHLLGQVDQVIVSDNASTDGTREILQELHDAHADTNPYFDRVVLLTDDEVAYHQDRKTTRLADFARDIGHQWVVPCDADEFWYATDGRRIADYLNGLAPDVAVVEADLYNHIPTALDQPAYDGVILGVLETGEMNPFRRIGWRQREHGALGKVAARALPGLEIRMGNHSAYVPGAGMTVSGGLCVRHYSWRSAEQYVRKIRNGSAAYAATDMPADFGAHWRMFDGATDDAIAEHFRTWFWRDDPYADSSLIYDPAPGA